MAADFETLPIQSKTIPELAELSSGDVADVDLLIVHDSSTAAERKFSFASLKNYLTLFFVGLFTRNVASISALSAVVNVSAGRVANVSGYYSGSPGIGGGKFIELVGGATPDGGSIIASATAGRYWLRQKPEKTPYEFGYLDGDDDVSVAVNACTIAYGECYLDAGKTYNSQYAINAKKLWCSGGVATINATSPTANDRFGSNNAVVVASGALGNPLEGVDVRNIIINCNQLRYANNSTYIKGTIFYRLKNFYQSGCTVIGCGSYAYWDWDDIGGTTYCSGTRDDCWAIDAGVSFEQVNVRGVTLNNCHAYRSTATLAYQGNVECQFHAYGGADMQVVYNNCTGVADGYVPAIFLALLECKNITANDCQFINNAVLSGQVSAAVYFSNDNGNYDNFTFTNCVLKSVNSVAVFLDRGALGSTSARFKFTGCRINGETVGVQFNNTGSVYSFTDCETTGATVSASTPFAYYNNGASNIIQITRGSATATGSTAVSATNLDSSVFVSTVLTPAGQQLPVIRQRVVSQVVLSVGDTTYARGSLNFPNAVLGWTSPGGDTSKVVVNAYINGPKSGVGTFPDQTSVSRGYSAYMASNQTVYIFFEDPANTLGKTAMVEITEYL